MRYLFLLLFLISCSEPKTFIVVPSLVVNDCKFAVQKHSAREFLLKGEYRSGWYVLENETISQKNGRILKRQSILRIVNDDFEYLVFETVVLNDQVCHSVYSGRF